MPAHASTRPMKHRVRQAAFNLIGPEVVEKHAIDLFAGSGALGIEAISRGAARATFVEQHVAAAAVIRENVRSLRIEHRATIVKGSSFVWVRRERPAADRPWLVFCTPPYDLYQQQRDAMIQMLEQLVQTAPRHSTFVVESDRRFAFDCLPCGEAWDVRQYPPARLGILRK